MPALAVEPVDLGPRKVARRVLVNAPANELFGLVADPRRHHELDGSGTVQATVIGPDRLDRGSTFSMSMRMFGFPYRVTSTVTAFEDGRVIEWRHPFGHRWRWEFAEVSSADAPVPQTQVTEVFDYSSSKLAKSLELGKFPQKNAKGISATLENLRRRYA
ncbi:SRPBCC family protein [Rhodococcus daqingensis]|uniref:SRPBCC family protein n=1 Tax=Rhodococcus daqingensis TaxID=2479363 RepID=A0ABW2RYJ8_9NOCA